MFQLKIKLRRALKMWRGRARIVPLPEDNRTVRTSFDLDLMPLQVAQWAPVHMSRSERLLLYTLVYSLRPRRYLEIGTLKGGSALIVASALDALALDTPMVCVDPDAKIAPEHWQRLEHRTTLLAGYSPEMLPDAYRAAGGGFDLVLIDGDHTYRGALRDAEGVLPFVERGAYLLFHDCFYPEVERGINDFIRLHPGDLVDFGPLTREVSVEPGSDGKPEPWGGIRVVHVGSTNGTRNGAR